VLQYGAVCNVKEVVSVLLVLYMMTSGWLENQSVEEMLVFKLTTFDLGEVKAGSFHTGGFEYENRSGRSLEIEMNRTNCRCRVSKDGQLTFDDRDRTVLPAGDKGWMTFEVNVPERGELDGYLRLKVRAADGQVEVKVLNIKAKVTGSVAFVPDKLVFDITNHPEQMSAELTVNVPEGDTLTRMELDGPLQYLDIEQVEKNRFKLTLKKQVYLLAGARTSNSLKATYDVGRGRIRYNIPVEFIIPNPCDVDPHLVVFRRGESAQVKKVYLNHDGSLKIKRIQSKPDYMAVSYGAIPGENKVVVLIKLTEEPRDGNLNEEIFLETQNPDRPVRIRTTGRLERTGDKKEPAVTVTPQPARND